MSRLISRERIEQLWPLLSLLLLVAVVALIASALSPELSRATTTMLVYVVVVVGLYMFLGNSGVPSFGHTAFMAVGAYVSAILVMTKDDKTFLYPSLPHWLISAHLAPVPAILIGGLCAAVLAAIVGVPIARMSPLAASLGTFAVLAIVFNVTSNLQAIGGSSGINGAPSVVTNTTAYIWAAAAIAVAFIYQGTRWCLRLRASREDEAAARSVGISIARERFAAFVLSAFVVGVGGGVFALNLGFFTPQVFFLSTAFIVLVMLLVGGSTSLAGAVVGVITITAVQEVLKRVESNSDVAGIQNLVLAVILIVIMIKRPLGIMGGREISWPFSRQRRPDLPAASTAVEPEPATSVESTQQVAR